LLSRLSEVRMARDHRRLRVFHEAHELTLAVYRETRNFPRDEWFGLRAQIRRAAVSIPANIVEGNARRGSGEYSNFLNIARGSASEIAYLIDLASELGYFSPPVYRLLQLKCIELIPQLERLVQKMDVLVRAERERQR
jgi:four helix bundle protein